MLKLERQTADKPQPLWSVAMGVSECKSGSSPMTGYNKVLSLNQHYDNLINMRLWSVGVETVKSRLSCGVAWCCWPRRPYHKSADPILLHLCRAKPCQEFVPKSPWHRIILKSPTHTTVFVFWMSVPLFPIFPLCVLSCVGNWWIAEKVKSDV